ncbi:MAG: polyprenyl synthetase family protein [Candidatus Omnitrophota bacterium]|jgi:geranylgeranyl diphosphate synthase type II|nr:MAG: polyprenyl synthetase family protein [Candidatus Omnitrophota bacterium]
MNTSDQQSSTNQPSLIKAYLKKRKEEIEQALNALLPEPEGHSKRLNEAIRYPLEAGGKRIRPILALVGADFCRRITTEQAYRGESWAGVDMEFRQALLTVACAIEMIHTYSLIHDDLPCMDDDDLRRGRPTSHIVYGEAMAVLSADALHTLGFQMIASIPERFALEGFRVVRELAVACGYPGMVAGQVVDLEYESKPGNEEVLEFIHLHKTAALIQASLQMGAIMASGQDRDREILRKVGYNLGLIFQVVDDILDVVGDTRLLGKKTGSDQAHAKLTYPSLIGLEESKNRVEKLKNEIMALLEPEKDRAAILIDITNELVRRQT